jgi:hypothetical protein
MRFVIFLVLVFEFVFAYAKEGTSQKVIPVLTKLDKDERAVKVSPKQKRTKQSITEL